MADPVPSGGLVLALAEVLDQLLGGPQRKREYAHGSRLVGAIEKNAGVADIQVRHVLSLSETVRQDILRIVPHAARTGLVQAPAGNFGRVSQTFQLSA